MAEPIPQHDITKASKAFRQVWQFLREVGLWSEVVILGAGSVIAFCRGIIVAAREVKALIAGEDPPADVKPIDPPASVAPVAAPPEK